MAVAHRTVQTESAFAILEVNLTGQNQVIPVLARILEVAVFANAVFLDLNGPAFWMRHINAQIFWHVVLDKLLRRFRILVKVVTHTALSFLGFGHRMSFTMTGNDSHGRAVELTFYRRVR